MSVTTATLATRAEAAIRRLRDVEGVSVLSTGDTIREVHVVTRSDRAPKQIVRDVQTVLRTSLGLSIDHRVVSVAQAGPDAAAASAPEAAHPVAPVLDDFAPEDPTPAPVERIRFESVNLFVAGARTQAQVELRWRGLPRMGSASGWSTRDESHRLVAQAAAAAVQEFLADPVALSVQAVEFLEVGRHRLVVVALTLLAHRQERMLSGTSLVSQDTPQSVVLATLAALNRVVGGMTIKEPTEYVLRPSALDA